MKNIIENIFYLSFIVAVALALYGATIETEPELIAMTDVETGVQYVSDGKGGMLVRIDPEGFPVIDRAGD